MVKILVAGDYVPTERVADQVDNGNYSEVFSEVLPYTNAVDYAIINLESPVVESHFAKSIDKCGPKLKCSRKAIDSIVFAGFNMATLANNHFYDYGEEGVYDTLNACKEYGVEVVGGGRNIDEASRTFYKTIEGQRFAFINCCEHEFSIATKISGGSNPINPVRQYYAILDAKQNADKVIMIIHGGHELHQFPSVRMVDTYRFFIDAGADAVVNHHQHCYSGYEVYKEKPIFYGLGNFCFDWNVNNSQLWKEGYIVTLLFSNEHGVDFEISPYKQCDATPSVRFLKGDERMNFFNELDYLNRIISERNSLEFENSKYYKTVSDYELRIFEPYSGKIFNYLYNKGMLPRTLTKYRCLKILNHILCESHFEKITYALKSSVENVNK